MAESAEFIISPDCFTFLINTPGDIKIEIKKAV